MLLVVSPFFLKKKKKERKKEKVVIAHSPSTSTVARFMHGQIIYSSSRIKIQEEKKREKGKIAKKQMWFFHF